VPSFASLLVLNHGSIKFPSAIAPRIFYLLHPG
jgi:hypothetical protein